MGEPREHIEEIDRLKGFAILSVVCIHAQLYATTLFHQRVVNRAVPIFLVLFGVTSELFWQRAKPTLSKWYRSRFERTLIPFWAIAALFWLAVLATGSAAERGLDWRFALGTLVGYAPYIGMSWFVTLFLQLVLVYPGLRAVAIRLGPGLSLLLAGAIGLVHFWFFWDIVSAGVNLLGNKFVGPGWYYHWILLPRGIFCATSGLFIARLWGGRVGPRVTIAALVVTVLGQFAISFARLPESDVFYGTVRREAVSHFVDVPLTIALLGLFRFMPLPSIVDRFLVWCGLWSWGIYMGHLLVHELVHLAGLAPEMGPEIVRATYAVGLFVCGAALAMAGDWLRQRLRGGSRSVQVESGSPP